MKKANNLIHRTGARLLLIVAFLLSFSMSYGQVTTSGMNGKITGPDGKGLAGATVVAVHTPSGSQYGTSTDMDGNFRIPNMNVGGPYKVTVSFIGYEPYVNEEVYLNLGQTYKLSTELRETSASLEEIQVVGVRNNVFDGNRTGSETNISQQAIDNMPSIGRNFSDYTRLTPQARVTQLGGVEIAGTNNRYNSIFIDGAVNNDVFGLTNQGTNGGQTGISPFSMDIIDQISIQVAPYDIKLGGFAGAGINAVTRRGNNDFQGSAYYITRNEGMAGLTPTDDATASRSKLTPFTSNTYGFRLGGPIIKNKLFFFMNAEMQKDETPQPFDFTTYNGAATAADLSALVTKLNAYGYDPGGYTDVSNTLDGKKFFIRLDWNINDVNKLMIRHQYTNAEQTSPANSSITAIRFANSGIFFPSTTNSTAIELKSNISNEMSNNLILGITSVNDDRDPMGNNFPYVRIKDGTSNIYFGSEEFSTGNQLKQNIITLTDNFELYKGKHTLTFGTHNEFYKMYNLFIRQNFGSYQFNSMADFMGDLPAYQYDRTFSAVDDITGDGSKAAAEFNALQLGVYAQDEIQVSDKFKLTAGLRIDVPMFLSSPSLNADFNDNVIPILEAAGWDLEGAKTGQTPDPAIMFNPRVGFNYDVKGDQTFQLRGGAGIFTSRIPFVWPGASFQNNGVVTGGMRVTAAGSPELLFNPDWNNQPVLPPTQPSGQVDIFAKNFKFPQVFRTSIGLDKKLPWGLIGTVDVIYTKNLNNVMYHNLRYVKNGTLTNGGDNRPIWTKVDYGVDGTTGKNRAYTDIMLGTNTSKGYSYNISAQLQKNFSNGFTGSVAYNLGHAKSMNDGVSSQNSSQWRVPNVRGKNDLDLAYSDFDMGSRVVGFVSYKKEYLKSMATTVSLFYTGQSGPRYSYGYADGGSAYFGEDNNSLDLLYVPKDASDINLVDITVSGNTLTAAEQWTNLDAFINGDEYLKSHRGQYVERNHSRLPFTNIFDFRVAQEFYVNAGGAKNTLQVSFDIFNLGNLINKDWGRIYYSSGAYYNNYPLVKVEGFEADGTTPRLSFQTPKNNTTYAIDDSGLLSSRWQGQLTIRYIFK
ncbi:MAG: TonB-dependent receptor [Bacteroidales bacterium]|nr:TonB-dependent receptor [Bacteroidales bacterium]